MQRTLVKHGVQVRRKYDVCFEERGVLGEPMFLALEFGECDINAVGLDKITG